MAVLLCTAYNRIMGSSLHMHSKNYICWIDNDVCCATFVMLKGGDMPKITMSLCTFL